MVSDGGAAALKCDTDAPTLSSPRAVVGFSQPAGHRLGATVSMLCSRELVQSCTAFGILTVRYHHAARC